MVDVQAVAEKPSVRDATYQTTSKPVEFHDNFPSRDLKSENENEEPELHARAQATQPAA
ncbi:hypothetical protein Vi05172_g9456 [Venturia inaequalis]|nr:hypothetical protein Vi05172_g9456 [Venturia inaequalis]